MDFLKSLYQSNDLWERHFDEIERKIKKLNIKPIIRDREISINSLKNNLELLENIYRELDALYTYILVKYETNIKDEFSHRSMYRVDDLYKMVEDKSEKFNHTLEKYKSEFFEILYKDKNLNFLITYYNKYFETNTSNPYEELYSEINIKDSYNNIIYPNESLGKIQFKGAEYTVTNNNYFGFLNSHDRKLRKSTYIQILKHFSSKEDEAAFLVNLDYKIKNKISTFKGYTDYFDELMDNGLLENDSEKFLYTSKEVGELFKQTLNLQRKILGLERISYYDMFYMGESCSYISLEDAKSIIKNALSIYGEDYLNLIDQVFNENWIHYKNSSNKKIGGRSYSSFNSHPYIIMNWNSDIDSLYVLTHEIGGAIAQYLAQNSGSILYSELSEVKVEFASVLNELVLSEYLMNTTNTNISEKEIIVRVLGFLKDDYFIPNEYMLILNNLLNQSKSSTLTSSLIENQYAMIVESFTQFEYFEDLNLNKKNWIRDHDQLDLEYNINYVYSFLLVSNFDIKNIDEVLNLYKQGEKISDKQFIERIFNKKVDFLELNKNSIIKIEEFLKNINVRLSENTIQ